VLLKRAEAAGARLSLNLCRSHNTEATFSSWGLLLRSLAEITSIDYNPQIHYKKFQRLVTRVGLPADSIQPLAALMGLRWAEFQEAEQPVKEAPGDEESLLDLVKAGGVKRRASRLKVFDQLDVSQRSESGQTWQKMPERLGERERQELYHAVWELLDGLANGSALVIFFEDAHQMDAQSLDLLRYLGKQARNSRLCFILARRPDGDEVLDRRWSGGT
jgi:hypothetical protein